MANKIPTNSIICGDCKDIMTSFPDESVDLIYLDPPFFSNRHYEVIWGDDAEIRSFGDRWEGGIEHYVAWMTERLNGCHRVLKPSGSIYLHCDMHASHYLKVAMDKIFGLTNFRNEIVWQRTDAHNNVKRKYGAIHDNILFYSKTPKYVFDVMADRDDLSTAGLKEYSLMKLENGEIVKYKQGLVGRRLKLENATVPGVKGGDGKIRRQYEWRGAKPSPRRSWMVEKEEMEEMLADGRVYLRHKSKGAARCKVIYLDERSGIAPQDMWCNMGRMKSGIRYPTEKPERLLERIIRVSSKPGDIVLDPFCGCGTAISVAKRLGRAFIGIDVSPTACRVMMERIEYPEEDIIGIPDTSEKLRDVEPHEFQNWVCRKMRAINTSPNPSKPSGRDGGVDGVVRPTLSAPIYNGSPIQVKQSERVGIDAVKKLYATMRAPGSKYLNNKYGFIVALSFGRGAIETVATYKNEGSIIIKLLTSQDIIDGTGADGYYTYQ